jgi:ribosomal protein L11 methyltransferase
MVKEYREENAPEQEIFAGVPGSKEYWNACQVIVCFPLEQDSSELTIKGTESNEMDHLRVIDHAVSALGLDSSVQRQAFISPRNWEDTIRDSYLPLKIDNDLWIIPRWTDIRDEDAINIVLEPGIAFGTGDHPTTRLCLTWLNRLKKEGLQHRSIMDYGTGSGILAIGALLMGAESAVRAALK